MNSHVGIPRWLYLPALLALLVLALPLLALLSTVPWARLPAQITSPEGSAALALSLRTSALATVLIMLIGVPLGVVLSRAGRWAPTVRILVVVPMTMPPVVGGLALLSAFGRRSFLGEAFPAIGEFFAFSTAAVVLAQVFVGLPFLVLSAESALKSLDIRYVEAAQGLGASPARILFRIVLPLVAPALFSGTALAMARTLGEFGATLTFAGSLPGVTRTMPLAIYLQREAEPELALALAALLLLLATALVALAGAMPWAMGKLRSGRRYARPSQIDAPPRHEAERQTFTHSGRTISAEGWTAIIGPNGAGKTTLLRALAGISARPETPALQGAVLLTQNPALFPHLTVLDNVKFASRDDARAWQELEAVGATELAGRMPREISGGQAARVALARALAATPQLMLLDEPLAAVDTSQSMALREVLRARLRDIPTLMVTHDAVDVASLAQHLLVLEGGAITAYGSPQELLSEPNSQFLVEFSGLCAITGTVVHSSADGLEVRTTAGIISGRSDYQLNLGDPAVALFSPRAVTLSANAESLVRSARNQLTGQVEDVTHHGSYVRVRLGAGQTQVLADITAQSAAQLRLLPGDTANLSIKALQVNVVPYDA